MKRLLIILMAMVLMGCMTTPETKTPCPDKDMLLWYPDGSCPMRVPKGYFDNDEYSAKDDELENLYEMWFQNLFLFKPKENDGV